MFAAPSIKASCLISCRLRADCLGSTRQSGAIAIPSPLLPFLVTFRALGASIFGYTMVLISFSRYNRNSMPVTALDLRSIDLPDVASVLGTGLNSILNEDEDDRHIPTHSHSKSMVDSSLLRLETTHDEFPILVRDGRQGTGSMQPSASSSVVDLASQGAEMAEANGWASFGRQHRPGQQSLPMNTLRGQEEFDSAPGGILETPTKTAAYNRRSLDVKFTSPFENSNKRLSFGATPPSSSMPKLQASYSTNDIPTLKNTNGANGNLTHAEQHFQNHNVNMGRIPPNAVNRQSRDFTGIGGTMATNGEARAEDKTSRSFSSALQANAAPFGPPITSGASTTSSPPAATTPQFGGAYGYNYGMMNMGMANIGIGSPHSQWNGHTSPQYPGAFSPYSALPQPAAAPQQQPFSSPTSRIPDSQHRVMYQRRQQTADDNSRASNFKMEDVIGRVVELSKDQYGCRFLQKKIEEKEKETFDIIYEETKDHIVELMQDPFGNYLIQKLLEFSTNDRRTVLINNAAPLMVKIALNQHGTRALQKMIEYIDTPEQVQTIIRAFDGEVVTLIQDLNGNHVIQKCLNHLRPEHAQFIFDAVGQNCLIVGTHRHGCCVLQRCIDHATGDQKSDLVRYITQNAFSLIQDPFGNYVVQYILDLNIAAFTSPLCMSFSGHIVPLSKQKFSSNVIEKCLRVAEGETKRHLIEELMLPPSEMEKVLRDNFANYVVQTALDHGDKDQQDRLWDIIIPLLQTLRSTPCGRRLLSKLSAREGRDKSGSVSSATSVMTPKDLNSPFSTPSSRNTANSSMAFTPSVHYTPYGSTYTPTLASPTPHRYSNASLPNHLQNAVQQSYRAGPNVGPAMTWF
jgi:Pumilio-family RNA binding repeat